MCLAELRAFLKVSSDSNVNLKLQFVCLESSAEDILSIPSVKSLLPSLSEYVLRTDISVTNISETSTHLWDVVRGAWECCDGVVWGGNLPTIVGRTRNDSFLVLQRAFSQNDLPSFRALLPLSRNVTDVFDAFIKAHEDGAVTPYNVKKLYLVILFSGRLNGEEQRRMVKAYERKWVNSKRLDWGHEAWLNLFRLFANNERGALQGSSSSSPPKRECEIDADFQEASESEPRKPRKTGEDCRVDLFISFNGSEKLSTGFTTRELVTATEELVHKRYNNFGTNPFVFANSMAPPDEVVDAVLETRPGGLALFLITPKFFDNLMCVAELRAFWKASSDSNVNLKLRFVCLESSAEDILSIPSVKEQLPAPCKFERCEDVPVKTIRETSAHLCDVVFGAWECSDGVLSAHELPTVPGRTRFECFLALQRVFTEDDLPMFCSYFGLPYEVTNMLDAFSMVSGAVNQYNVKNLYEFIAAGNSPDAEENRRAVKAYERKWVESKQLSWADEARIELLDLFKLEESGPSSVIGVSKLRSEL